MPSAGKGSDGSGVVRAMAPGDLDTACRILVEQGLCAADGLPQRLAATLDMANSDYLVAEEDGAIVGITLSVFDGFTSFVSYMAVAPGAERRHIGRRMMDELVRRTRARGAKNIVVASWLSAAGFYEAMGFRTPGAVFLVCDVWAAARGPTGQWASRSTRS